MNVLYEFACAGGHIVERFFRMGDAPDTVMCEDHGAAARRRLSRGQFLTVPGAYNSTR